MENLTKDGEPATACDDCVRCRKSRANEDHAWLAGILDGEGYIGACQTNGFVPVRIELVINNCSLSLLNKCQRIIQGITGIKFAVTRYSDTKGRNFVFYGVRVGKQQAIWQLVNAIKPWLTVKRSQADAVVEFIESRKLNRHKREGYTAWEASLPSRVKRLKYAEYTPHPRRVETEREAPADSVAG